MKYTITQAEKSVIVALEGRFTYADHAVFNQLVNQVLEKLDRDCAFNLEKLDFIDSTGLGMLVIANDACKKRGFSLRLTKASGRVRTVLDRVEFATIIKIE